MAVIPYKFKNKAVRGTSRFASLEDLRKLSEEMVGFQTSFDGPLPERYFLSFQPEVFGYKQIGDKVVGNFCRVQTATVEGCNPSTEDFCNPFQTENASVPLDLGINEFTRNEGGFCVNPFFIFFRGTPEDHLLSLARYRTETQA